MTLSSESRERLRVHIERAGRSRIALQCKCSSVAFDRAAAGSEVLASTIKAIEDLLARLSDGRLVIDDDQGYVYFLHEGDTGPIKIGYSRDPNERMLAFRGRSNAAPLKLLATVRGSYSREALLHVQFAKSRINGEWFSPSTELIALIQTFSGASRTTSTTPVGPPALDKLGAMKEAHEAERAAAFKIWRAALEAAKGNVREAADAVLVAVLDGKTRKNRAHHQVRRLGLFLYAAELRARAGQPKGRGRPRLQEKSRPANPPEK